MEVKACAPSIVEHVVSIWLKNLRSPLEDTHKYSTATYPYEILHVDQVFPSRDLLEEFEGHRNELDKRLGTERGGRKLETVNIFYSPSSEEVLRRILQEGFSGAFAGALTFCSDPTQAIREVLSARPINKVILARVCLGIKDIDFTEINSKIKIFNLKGCMPSFVISFRQVADESGKSRAASSSPRSPESRAPEPRASEQSSAPQATYSSPTRLPKYITDLNSS